MEKQKIICDNCKREILNPNWQRDNLTFENRIEVIYCDDCKEAKKNGGCGKPLSNPFYIHYKCGDSAGKFCDNCESKFSSQKSKRGAS